MKVKITGHVTYVKYSWETEGRYILMASPATGADPSYTDVGVSAELEVEIPDEFNPTAMQLSALQKQKEDVREKFHAMVARIDKQISELQAIEHTA
jgi:hypothetical protein